MVSTEEAKLELIEREEELSDFERQASKLTQLQIPERRFGSGITPKQQEQVGAFKKSGESTLFQIKEERQKIEERRIEIKNIEQENIRIESERAEINKQIEDYNLARKFIIEGKPPLALTKSQQKIYYSFKNEESAIAEKRALLEKQNEQLKQQQTALNKQSQQPILAITKAPEPKGFLEKIIKSVDVAQFRRKFRKEQSPESDPILSEIYGETIKKGAGVGIFAKKIITEPITTAKGLGRGLEESFKKIISGEGFPELSKKAREEPISFTTDVAFELATFKGTSIALRKAEQLGEIGLTRADPRYIKTIESSKATLIPSGKITNIPSEFERTFEIPLASSVQRIKEPVSKQIKLAGTKQTLVSAQTDFFGNIFKKEVILERDLFFDPRGRLRTSRFGLNAQKEASLLDVISGDFTIRKGKKQALVLEKFEIEKLPMELKDIELKLKKGIGLSSKEFRRFIEFKEIPSGKAKPVPKLSSEPEVVFPIGTKIKKGKTIGVTLIRGRRVTLIRPEIVKPVGQEISLEKQIALNDKSLNLNINKFHDKSSFELSGSRDRIPKRRLSLSRSGYSIALSRKSRLPSRKSISLDRFDSKLSRSLLFKRSLVSKKARLSRASSISAFSPISSFSNINLATSYKSLGKSIRRSNKNLFRKIDIFDKPFLLEGKRKQKKVRKRKINEAIIFTPSFTAKILNIEERIPKSKLNKFLKRIEKGYTPLNLRKVPIFTK